jgi:hypothetical protein
LSLLSLLRLARLGDEVEDLRATRAELVTEVRELVEKLVDPEMDRMFTQEDFRS